MKKILFYNWVPLNQSAGGGVAVYQINILKALAHRPEYEIYYLSSGFTYDLSGKLRIKAYEGMEKIHCFDIINSPVFAPGNLDSGNLKKYLDDTSLKTVIEQFVAACGGFDVAHLNNIEGLTLSAIKALKNSVPNTKMIYSGHNYFPICPQVNLWQATKDGFHNCSGGECRDCAKNCVVMRADLQKLRRIVHEFKGTHKVARTISILCEAEKEQEVYDRFIRENLGLLNDTVDQVLAVSNRVAEIFIRHGVRADQIRVSYIGTKAAESAGYAPGRPFAEAQKLKIVYMGYMRQDKGGFFMLDVLEKMPEQLAGKLDVLFVAKDVRRNKQALHRLEMLKSKFTALNVKDGYQRSEQAALLQDRELGIIPVQWEDNLPQVAIEQIAAGVPILTSNLGGAAELFNHREEFVFPAESSEILIQKLENILEHKELLSSFWNSVNPLVTMDMHIHELQKIYGE